MRSAAARLLLIPLITATIALTGCTPKTSLERHTRHYVYASDDGFDPVNATMFDRYLPFSCPLNTFVTDAVRFSPFHHH